MSDNIIIGNESSSLLNQALNVFNKKLEITKQVQEIKKEVANDCENKILQIQHTDIIPQELKGKTQELIEIAKLADYKGIPFLNLVNNIQFIDGKMGWKSTYIIACINKAKDRFSAPLNYRTVGKEGESSYGRKAYSYDLRNNLVEGPTVTIEMAEKAGWKDKEKSFWNINADLMLCYRAATFFGRLYTPDILDGMHTVDELVDIFSVSGSLPKNAIDEKVIEALKEADSISIAQIKDEIKAIVPENKIGESVKKLKSTLEAMIEDFEKNDWLVGIPTLHKEKFFIKVESNKNKYDEKILLKWGFGKTKNGSLVKDITSLMTEEEINEYK